MIDKHFVVFGTCYYHMHFSNIYICFWKWDSSNVSLITLMLMTWSERRLPTVKPMIWDFWPFDIKQTFLVKEHVCEVPWLEFDKVLWDLHTVAVLVHTEHIRVLKRTGFLETLRYDDAVTTAVSIIALLYHVWSIDVVTGNKSKFFHVTWGKFILKTLRLINYAPVAW